jgi:hypothetical protein
MLITCRIKRAVNSAREWSMGGKNASGYSNVFCRPLFPSAKFSGEVSTKAEVSRRGCRGGGFVDSRFTKLLEL